MLPMPGKRTIADIRSKPSVRSIHSECSVKDCRELGKHRHHVLYKEWHGRDVTFPLCGEHHSWITREQSHQGRKQHHALSEKQRWRNWYRLINGEMKRPRRTKLDIEREEGGILKYGTAEEKRAVLQKWNG
ncbi:MAG: hypothetical protein ACRD40_01735 [Candidatus Acidiferrales bacterium]